LAVTLRIASCWLPMASAAVFAEAWTTSPVTLVDQAWPPDTEKLVTAMLLKSVSVKIRHSGASPPDAALFVCRSNVNAAPVAPGATDPGDTVNVPWTLASAEPANPPTSEATIVPTTAPRRYLLHLMFPPLLSGGRTGRACVELRLPLPR